MAWVPPDTAACGCDPTFFGPFSQAPDSNFGQMTATSGSPRQIQFASQILFFEEGFKTPLPERTALGRLNSRSERADTAEARFRLAERVVVT